jgi:hypothetical protein
MVHRSYFGSPLNTPWNEALFTAAVLIKLAKYKKENFSEMFLNILVEVFFSTYFVFYM